MRNFLASIGAWMRERIADIGQATVLFVRLVLLAPACLRRFGLVRDHMHFLGNYSLAIITVSGLFVGFVLGLQGYYTLQRYGSSEALGFLVALSLVRELGPVVSALLFAGRAGIQLRDDFANLRHRVFAGRHNHRVGAGIGNRDHRRRARCRGGASSSGATTAAGATTATHGTSAPTKARKSGKATAGKATGGSTAASIRALALTRTRKNVRDQLSHFHRVRVL